MKILAHYKKAFFIKKKLNPSFFPMARTCTIPNFLFFFFSRPKYLPPQKNRKKSGENTGKKKLNFSLSLAS
jgi:hypothetical protein